jgi:hypothetical protein
MGKVMAAVSAFSRNDSFLMSLDRCQELSFCQFCAIADWFIQWKTVVQLSIRKCVLSVSIPVGDCFIKTNTVCMRYLLLLMALAVLILFPSYGITRTKVLVKETSVDSPFDMPAITYPDFSKCKRFSIADFGAVQGYK